jgi:hypothetical protein
MLALGQLKRHCGVLFDTHPTSVLITRRATWPPEVQECQGEGWPQVLRTACACAQCNATLYTHAPRTVSTVHRVHAHTRQTRDIHTLTHTHPRKDTHTYTHTYTDARARTRIHRYTPEVGGFTHVFEPRPGVLSGEGFFFFLHIFLQGRHSSLYSCHTLFAATCKLCYPPLR